MQEEIVNIEGESGGPAITIGLKPGKRRQRRLWPERLVLSLNLNTFGPYEKGPTINIIIACI